MSSASDSGVPSVDSPKSVLELLLEISLWNGMRLSLSLPATSNVIQLARNSSAPARRMARPFVHPNEVEHEVAREGEQVDAADVAATAVAVAEAARRPR